MEAKFCYCTACKSINTIRNGKLPNGKQRYICKDCSNSFTEGGRKVYNVAFKQMVVTLYKSKEMSFRQIGKTFDISYQTVKNWVDKYA